MGYSVVGWEVSVLFVLFLAVTIVWGIVVGILTFLNNSYRGRKATWLSRVKEELLTLGIVSLFLLFFQPLLSSFCEEGKVGSADYEKNTACPEGQSSIFSNDVIDAAHYLLFYSAMVHILYSLLTSFVITQKIKDDWAPYEKIARDAERLQQTEAKNSHKMPDKVENLQTFSLTSDILGRLDLTSFRILRKLCKRRLRAHSVPLKTYNYLNLCEQCLDSELNHVYSHAWLMNLVMSTLLLFPFILYQTVWVSAFCLFLMVYLTIRLRYIIRKTRSAGMRLCEEIDMLREGDSSNGSEDDESEETGLDEEVTTDVVAEATDATHSAPGVTATLANQFNASLYNVAAVPSPEAQHQHPLHDVNIAQGYYTMDDYMSRLPAGSYTPMSSRPIGTVQNMYGTFHQPVVSVQAIHNPMYQVGGRPVAEGCENQRGPVTLGHVWPGAATLPLNSSTSDDDAQLCGAEHSGSSPGSTVSVQKCQPFLGRYSAGHQNTRGPIAESRDVNLRTTIEPGESHSRDSSYRSTGSSKPKTKPSLARTILKQTRANEEDEEYRRKLHGPEFELVRQFENEIKHLFVFHSPRLFLWAYNFIFVVSSITMTTSVIFQIPYPSFECLQPLSQPIYIWLPVIFLDVVIAYYCCWAFLPQFGLIITAATVNPIRLMEQVKMSKTAEETEEHGIAGVTLKFFTAKAIGRRKDVSLALAFITTLAKQAGLILAHEYNTEHELNHPGLRPVFREFVHIWHDVAWYGKLKMEYHLKAELGRFFNAFVDLDEDGSEALSYSELANMVRGLGAYATEGDIEAMLWEVDLDDSGSIGFDEFVKFMAYSFFDIDCKGYIVSKDIGLACARLGFLLTREQSEILLKACDNSRVGQISMVQFFNIFDKIAIDSPEKSEQEEASLAFLIKRAATQFMEPLRRRMNSHDS